MCDYKAMLKSQDKANHPIVYEEQLYSNQSFLNSNSPDSQMGFLFSFDLSYSEKPYYIQAMAVVHELSGE